MRKTLISISCLIALFAISSCAPKKAPDVVQIWPKAPKPPQIAFIKTHHGDADYAKPTVLDYIFGAAPRSTFLQPYGLVVKNDKIFVALVKGGSVAIVDTKAKKISYVGHTGKLLLQSPLGVALAANGTVYVSDPELKLVMGYSQDGNLQVVLGTNKEFERPTGLAVSDDLQRLYIVDTRAHKVNVVSLSGERLFAFGQQGNMDGDMNYPLGIAIDKRNGNVVVVDSQNFRVQVFDRDGKFLRKFGQAGDGFGSFGMPKFVAVDRVGNIFVTDGFMQNFQIFDQNGNFLLYVMGAEKGQAAGQFQHPGGIFVDDSDRIFLTEVADGAIHELQYLSPEWIKDHPEEYKKFITLQPLDVPAPGTEKAVK